MRNPADLTGEIFDIRDLPAARNSIEDEWRIRQHTGIHRIWRTFCQCARLDRRAVTPMVVPELSPLRRSGLRT